MTLVKTLQSLEFLVRIILLGGIWFGRFISCFFALTSSLKFAMTVSNVGRNQTTIAKTEAGNETFGCTGGGHYWGMERTIHLMPMVSLMLRSLT
jgi:hypothetical protein